MRRKKTKHKGNQPVQSRETIPIKMNSEKETKNDDGSKRIPEQFMIADWFKKFAEPMTIVTLLLFCATLALYYATRELVEDARHTAERQLRAYVFVENAGIQLSGDEKKFAIHIGMKNFGQTPAYSISTSVSYRIEDRDGVFNDPAVAKEKNSIVPPSGIINIDDTQIMSAENLRAMRASTKAVFVWAAAEYTDTFGMNWQLMCRFISGKHELTDVITNQPWRGWNLEPGPRGCEERRTN